MKSRITLPAITVVITVVTYYRGYAQQALQPTPDVIGTATPVPARTPEILPTARGATDSLPSLADLNPPVANNPPQPLKVVVDGEAASDIMLLGYRGYPLTIRVRADEKPDVWSMCLPEFASTSGKTFDRIEGSSGAIETHALSRPENSPVLITAAEGYKLTSAHQLSTSEPLQLDPWCRVQGHVTLTGTGVEEAWAADEAWVVARWESVPFFPPLTGTDPSILSKGPGLFALYTAAPLGTDRSFSFDRLPPGRIQFTVIPHALKHPEDWGCSNLSWWQTVRPVTNSTLPPVELGEKEFPIQFVTGKILQSDELADQLTSVTQKPDGGLEIRQWRTRIRPDRLNVSYPNGIYESGPQTSQQNLEAQLKKAVVWGREGGQRERTPSRIGVEVNPDGSFACVLPAGTEHTLTLIREAVIETNVSSNTQSVWTMLATDIARVTSTQDDTATDVVELGEISVTDKFVPDQSGGFGFNATVPAPTDEFPPPLRESQEVLDSFANERPVRDREALDDRTPNFQFAQPYQPPVAVRNQSPSEVQTSSLDKSIAELVAKLLATGDRRDREALKEPLKKMLQKRFDAEQKAREELLATLRKRFETATDQVEARAKRKDEIVNEQLQRMLGLPEDDFRVLPDDTQLPPDYSRVVPGDAPFPTEDFQRSRRSSHGPDFEGPTPLR